MNYGHIFVICYSEFKSQEFDQSFDFINNILKQKDTSVLDEDCESDSCDYMTVTDSDDDRENEIEKSKKRKE